MFRRCWRKLVRLRVRLEFCIMPPDGKPLPHTVHDHKFFSFGAILISDRLRHAPPRVTTTDALEATQPARNTLASRTRLLRTVMGTQSLGARSCNITALVQSTGGFSLSAERRSGLLQLDRNRLSSDLVSCLAVFFSPAAYHSLRPDPDRFGSSVVQHLYYRCRRACF